MVGLEYTLRPFRIKPPEAVHAIIRPELQRVLLNRFERRVTVISAGAGYGKTTALALAVAKNGRTRLGIDIWLTCENADKDPDSLLSGLAQAVGHEITSVADMAAWAVSQSPAQVCLILDDAHKIGTDSEGALLVADLIEALPANGHVLLSSRSGPPVALARLDAQHQVAWLGPNELRLSESEVAELASRTGVPVLLLSRFEGWPALVALAVRSRDVNDFLHEEVMAWLTTDQRAALETVVAMGTVDGGLLLHIAGVSPSTLGDLPLIQYADGWFVAHELWVDAVETLVAAEHLDGLRHRGIEYLIDKDESLRAVEACLHGSESDLLQRAMRAVIMDPTAISASMAKQWLSQLPPDARDTAIADYLTGLVLQHMDLMSESTRDHFWRASERFRLESHPDAEVMALVQVGRWCHMHRDIGGYLNVGIRINELAAQGSEAALPYRLIGEASIALIGGRPKEVLDALQSVVPRYLFPASAAMADWLRAQALEMSGHRSVDAADACLSHGVALIGFSVLPLSSRWRCGDLEDLVDGWRFDDEPFNDLDGSLRHIWSGIISAAVGNHVEARQFLDKARQMAGSAEQVDIGIGILETVIATQFHDPGRRREIVREVLERYPPSETNRMSYNGAAGVIARDFPEWIPYFEATGTGPIRRRDLDIAAALRRMDEGSLDQLAELTWPDQHGGLVSAALMNGAAEIICGSWALGRPEAASAAAWMARVLGERSRMAFRSMTTHKIDVVASAATKILAGIPVPPLDPVELDVLGPVRLEIKGELVTDPNWRRGRVRSLLGFLLLHQSTTRDLAISALWPDADESSGRRNLRSTLNLLNGVLEPGRAAGEAPYFVRSDGQSLELYLGDHLSVDTCRFDQILNEAERLEKSGMPGQCLESLQRACALYRGDFLPESLYDDWSAMERERLRSRFVRGSVRLAELLLAYARTDEALAAAGRALETDPWSEAAHRVLVAAHLDAGDRGAARRALKRCIESLDEIGGPSEELTFMLQRRLEVT